MSNIRIIARIDVKNEFVIKGIHLEGLRKVGDPDVLAKKYYEAGIDEIVFIDAVASLYGRNNLFGIAERACKEVFIPITIGGGIRTLDDIKKCLKAGADKVAINTQAIKTPEIIREAALSYGSQCIVASIEAKQKRGGGWEAYIDNGRESTGVDVLEWAQKLEDLGAGEILLTSIDMEGTRKGFDLNLISVFAENISIPLVISGGGGKLEHLDPIMGLKDIGGIVLASMLHYELFPISKIKEHMTTKGFEVRHVY